MEVFDWETFWINHPKQELKKGNDKWANLRPKDYSYKVAFDEINEKIDLQQTDKVLEVGCGTGNLIPFVNEIIPSYHIVASDFSQVMIDAVREKYQGITVVKAPAHMLPFIDGEFDKVFCSGVIQHIATPFFVPTIKEMLRVTKIGGKVFIGDILQEPNIEAGIFNYSLSDWEPFREYGELDFSESSFEKRLNVILTKKTDTDPISDLKKDFNWGLGDGS